MCWKEAFLNIYEYYNSLEYDVRSFRQALALGLECRIFDSLGVESLKDRIMLTYFLQGDLPEIFRKPALDALKPHLKTLAFWIGKRYLDDVNPTVTADIIKSESIVILAVHPEVAKREALEKDLFRWFVSAPNIIRDMERCGLVTIKNSKVITLKKSYIVSRELRHRVKELKLMCPICGERELAGRVDSKVCRLCKDKFDTLARKAEQVYDQNPGITYADFCSKLKQLKEESDNTLLSIRKIAPWRIVSWESVCALLWQQGWGFRLNLFRKAVRKEGLGLLKDSLYLNWLQDE